MAEAGLRPTPPDRQPERWNQALAKIPFLVHITTTDDVIRIPGYFSGLEDRLKAQAARLGFASCGIAPAADDPVRAQRLEQWLGERAYTPSPRY